MEMGRSDSQDTLNTRFPQATYPLRPAQTDANNRPTNEQTIENKALGGKSLVGHGRVGHREKNITATQTLCVDWVTRVLPPPSE